MCVGVVGCVGVVWEGGGWCCDMLLFCLFACCRVYVLGFFVCCFLEGRLFAFCFIFASFF